MRLICSSGNCCVRVCRIATGEMSHSVEAEYVRSGRRGLNVLVMECDTNSAPRFRAQPQIRQRYKGENECREGCPGGCVHLRGLAARGVPTSDPCLPLFAFRVRTLRKARAVSVSVSAALPRYSANLIPRPSHGYVASAFGGWSGTSVGRPVSRSSKGERASMCAYWRALRMGQGRPLRMPNLC
jgi:hypothetical protein